MTFKIFKITLLLGYGMLLSCKNPNQKTTLITDEKTTEQEAKITPATKVTIENEDLQKIIQQSIDLPELQQYFHSAELPERAPLIIVSNNKIPTNLELEKFGEKVQILDVSELKNKEQAHLLFSTIVISENTASTIFNYPIEGIHVSIEFAKLNNEWTVVTSKLNEQ
ncbi:hypothetical protein [Cellulophaga sp. L1A9]|uniref:hypothetical protein n=1 Tax=Cellulophaga sp. L1A9 TaxID=2686362 RepID=UPI00131E2C29|nr:hypothetical protein [Cellulophaga sp. L1A9]